MINTSPPPPPLPIVKYGEKRRRNRCQEEIQRRNRCQAPKLNKFLTLDRISLGFAFIYKKKQSNG
jgi:hypothetical protein